jgi:hypothetical protein
MLWEPDKIFDKKLKMSQSIKRVFETVYFKKPEL